MGFRSTFTTSDYPVEWPQWFRAKYAGAINFPSEGEGGGISAAREYKTSGFWADLPEDIQKSMEWPRIESYILVYLHECGGITRCQIKKNAILWSEPLTWKATGGVTHDYCYGCSDVDK